MDALPGDVVFALGALLMAWDFLIKLGPLLPSFFSGEKRDSRTGSQAGSGPVVAPLKPGA